MARQLLLIVCAIVPRIVGVTVFGSFALADWDALQLAYQQTASLRPQAFIAYALRLSALRIAALANLVHKEFLQGGAGLL